MSYWYDTPYDEVPWYETPWYDSYLQQEPPAEDYDERQPDEAFE